MSALRELLQQPVKPLIEQHAQVGEILEAHDIGCVPCTLGTCKLGDIVELHALSPEVEQQLMSRIAALVYPEQKIEVPLRARAAVSSGPLRYSPPMQALVDEHKLIKRVIACIPRLAERVDVASDEGRDWLQQTVDFIRGYADRFHHAKEEEILFAYFDPELEILKVMHADHETGRAHVKAVLDGVEARDAEAVAQHLRGYRAVLTQHIQKEDEILYPWMDRELSDHDIGVMYGRFGEVDAQFGDRPAAYARFVERLESWCDRS